MRKLILPVISALIITAAVNVEAAFERSAGPRILLAEVSCYGQFELKPEFMENFYDVISEKLQEKFDVETRVTLADKPTDEDEIFSTIHMDAIAHSHLYRRELANAAIRLWARIITRMRLRLKRAKSWKASPTVCRWKFPIWFTSWAKAMT